MKSTVLVIDDEIVFLETIKELLEAMNYNAVTLNEEEDSVRACLQHLPDLIICDVNMPKRSGYDVVKQLKHHRKTADIPVLMLTANGNRSSFRKGMTSGADDFLTKPVSAHELQEAIECQISKTTFRKQSLGLRKQQAVAKQGSSLTVADFDSNDHDKSLRSAARIQGFIKAKMPDLGRIFDDFFILDHPQHIVSGDSYWISEKDDTVLVAVMDCTGHGLPAAMLTMLCHSKLDEAVYTLGITDPAMILNKVDQLIRTFLGMESSTGLGMDIGLCAIHTSSRCLTYTGANRPLYLLRKKTVMQDEPPKTCRFIKDASYTLVEFKGDSFGVGSKEKNDQVFRTHVLNYAEGDTIYLNSDGYQDQFGGPNNKKFKVKNYRNLLFSARHSAVMDDQRTMLEESFLEWKGTEEQTDDVLVMGIRLK